MRRRGEKSREERREERRRGVKGREEEGSEGERGGVREKGREEE